MFQRSAELDGGRLSKLSLAVITAAPMRPSNGDYLRLRAMGYTGVQDVAERAMAYNIEAGKCVLPVPLGGSMSRVHGRQPFPVFSQYSVEAEELFT